MTSNTPISSTLSDGALERSVEVNGTTVSYVDSVGEGDGRTPLVLVHGTGGRPDTHFNYIFPMLATRGRVIAVQLTDPADRAETGRSIEIDDFAAQIAAVIADAAPGQRVALIGYSLGAVATAVTAARHPELLESLTLVSGWAQTDNQQLLRSDVWFDLYASGSEKIKEYTVFCAFGGPFLAAKNRADLQPAIDVVKVDDYTAAQMDLNRRIDIRDELERIDTPTLIVGGTYDVMVPLRHQKYLFGAIEDARLTEIAAGHAVVFERPAELIRVIENFTGNPQEYPAGTRIPALKP